MRRARSALMLTLWVVSTPSAAQPAPDDVPSALPSYAETIDVAVVQLEAVVTDRRGRRARGLGAKDFRLRVDGVETPISFCNEVDARARVADGLAAAADAASEPSVGPFWQGRSVLVFFDEATMVKARRDSVLRSLARQVDDLDAGDRVAVVAFTGARLEVLSGWSSDLARLAGVLAAATDRPSYGIAIAARRREGTSDAGLQEALALALPADGSVDGFSGARAMEPSMELSAPPLAWPARAMGAPEAAAAAMRLLPIPPGRKLMLLLTEGFSYPALATPVVYEANRLGYSVYPVDVQGLDTTRAANDVELAAPHPVAFITTELDRNTDFTLQVMAAATGGRAALNSNRRLALHRLVEDSASYYLLGFSPSRTGEVRRHTIELTSTRPDLRVRTRASWVEPGPAGTAAAGARIVH